MIILPYVDFIVQNCIEYMISRNNLLDFANFFSPNDCKTNSKIINKFLKDKYGKRKPTSWL